MIQSFLHRGVGPFRGAFQSLLVPNLQFLHRPLNVMVRIHQITQNRLEVVVGGGEGRHADRETGWWWVCL